MHWLLLLLNDVKEMEAEVKKNEDFIRLFEMRNSELKELIEKRKITIEDAKQKNIKNTEL